MISKAATVDEFMAGLSEDEQALFTKIRALFKKHAKGVTESMQYRMPTYARGEQMIGAFNKQKNYLSLYIPPEAIDPYREELGKLDCGKSCIRFRQPADLPLKTVEKMIKAAGKRP